jgi:rubredoxin
MGQSCPDCGLQNKQQYFIPRDHKYELNEEIERKDCPDPNYKSKNYSVFMAEKDTVLYPSPEPKREATYRVLTIDGKCSCGSDQGYSKEEWHFQPGTTWTPKKHNQKCPDCGKEYYINWTEEQRTYL